MACHLIHLVGDILYGSLSAVGLHIAEAEASGSPGPPVNGKTGLGWQFTAQSLKSSRPPLYHQMPTFTCLGHWARGPTQVRPRVAPKGSCSPTPCGYGQHPGHTVSFEWPWPRPPAAEEAGWLCLWRLLRLPGPRSARRCGLSDVGSTRMIPVLRSLPQKEMTGPWAWQASLPFRLHICWTPQGGKGPLIHFHLEFGAISPNSTWPILSILLTKF